jgi:hypothetical protein
MKDSTRLNEWLVPQFGPLKFRAFIGLLFLPYTGMCVSFTIIGSMLSLTIFWDRTAAIFIIYFFALGISAHAADNLGSKQIKPWGNYFSKTELKIMIIAGLSVAYFIGLYYALNSAYLLLLIGIIEGFFLFAYNFELFKGLFHNNLWFAISWGSLPLLAGYIIQTNTISEMSLFSASCAFVVSYIEIRISRRYKELKRKSHDNFESKKLESYLKIISFSTILFCITLIISRIYML